MNRKIKFRAWHKVLREMFVVKHLQFGIEGLVKVDTGTLMSDDWHIEDLDLMQYTGLEDCYGKDIFEGDILRSDDESIGVIKWGTACFYCDDWCDGYIPLEDLYANRFAVIIGNVYENSDLLKERKNE